MIVRTDIPKLEQINDSAPVGRLEFRQSVVTSLAEVALLPSSIPADDQISPTQLPTKTWHFLRLMCKMIVCTNRACTDMITAFAGIYLSTICNTFSFCQSVVT